MKVKTYRAATLKAALKDIKQELGPDAFILGQKEVRSTSLLGRKKQVEVTAAIDHQSEPPKPVPSAKVPPTCESDTSEDTKWLDAVRDDVRISRPANPAISAVQATPDNLVLLDEVRKLKALVQSISIPQQPTPVFVKPRRFSSAVRKQLYGRLAAHGIDEELAYTLTSANEASAENVAAGLAGRISVFPDFIRTAAGGAPEIVALLGPTGVGKTTTIAKIAAIAALQKSLKVGLVTLDTFRIAAIAQLKTYAEIMGVPLRTVESVRELHSAIQAFSDRDLVLIDTTGRSHREICQEWELANFLAQAENIRKTLVTSATTSRSDLKEIVERHGIFRPDCLIFTKLDEAETHGAIISELVRSGLPLAYATIGQGVPNDILRPEARPLVDLAIGADRREGWSHFIENSRATWDPQQPESTHKASRRLVQ